uniref:Caprin-1_dimer domain-containing protein n=1 Tax=Rhodnius prolixus TaxID=13249 RepID=T1HHU8_RHOPR
MPTASVARLEKQASLDANDPLRQAIVMIDHKIRNLEKRKGRLDSYRDLQKNGKDLNSDQLEAISKYDAVIAHLDFAKELSKHLTTLAIDSAKNIKKQARKEALERAQQELARTKDILIIQDVLASMGQDAVREDLLNGKAKVTLTAEELQAIDDLYVELTPKRDEPMVFTLFSTLGYSYFVFIVTILGGITIEEPQPAPIETTYFTPSHLRVFKSGTIDFMQENELDIPDSNEPPSIPTMTYTNQSFSPLEVASQQVGPTPQAPAPPPAATTPTAPSALHYQNQTDEEKGWSTNTMVVEPQTNVIVTTSTQKQTNAVPQNEDLTGFITAGGSGRGRGGRGRGGGDRNKGGYNNRGGNRGGSRGGYNREGGYINREGGGNYREGSYREGNNYYKDQSNYQNGYQNRGDQPRGGRGGANRGSSDRTGNRGGRGGRGSYRGSNNPGSGGYRQ